MEYRNDRSFPKYTISVVSEMTGVPVHTIRQYEQQGLIRPARTTGKTRRYSDEDVEMIMQIADLARKGINYPGIREVLRIRKEHTSNHPDKPNKQSA
ncbi:transcriptional regulator, MerR family [Thermobaculum terrenum ATCC BAA-798]|uniref:Transcriptional regulator, MerR family n=1 Tax=Thermobaculum terrenum (strain ATCC BAA-798 / CCMEE 7001 / YNP1) TaxID=525904 RepID=D1CEE8_THET1|nr:MerR family transcriptional regulator [Thermobaculum terrenum]ACZ41304.1 transcriptional regulator, MerR family [Thermobaculum terrenum ATCC BAA-798]